ncbi:MAG: hypothetical protein A2122_01805 [Candidatus Liptonbacteria bacterium GWB1_49_6]|uniref:Uncharacterized protein n=1 Tax=Candidatus Liptonbacteria bacterium GWB1_49_6 TaxID=1798644 RepID=A0A1G2C4C0_9BACT|nr:MAG: hypothetical protein A2122_01805 [Candidatus Liptonbacteria bacterium GWB1_49_6]
MVKKKKQKNLVDYSELVHITYFLIGVGIFIDTLLLKKNYDALFVVVSVLWLITMFVFKLSSFLSAKLGIAFILLSGFFLSVKFTNGAEDAGTWAYMFFAVALVKKLSEMRKDH